MNLFQKQQTTTSRYTSIPDAIADDDETAAVPFGTTIRSPSTMTMTMDHRSWMWLAFQFAGALLLLVAGGGTVWMLQTTDGGLTTTAVERYGDNGMSCCKGRNNRIDCEYHPYMGDDSSCMYPGCCVPINGYKKSGGHCHLEMDGKSCCTDEDHGTYYFLSDRCK